jgi:uncharacterized membrane protein HdeD (DUF308 family)
MNMKYRFQKFSKNNVLLSIVMIILGLLLIIWPGKTLEVAAKILGIALLVGGVISCFSWYRDRHVYGGDYTTLAIGILCLVAGLVVFIAPHGVITLLPKIIGVGIAVNGVLNLAQAMEMRKMGSANWIGPVIMAALTVVAGLFLVFFSFSAMKAAVMVIGGVIIYNGVSNLLIESGYRKAGR